MMELVFATTNPGKLRELRRLVEGLPVRVYSPDELERPLPDVVEDGDTFEANARKKALSCAVTAGRYALADDSGLCVDALGGRPGVHSARWSEADCPGGENGDGPLPRATRDEANNDKLLKSLEGTPDEQRGAEYRAVLVLACPDGKVAATVAGTCRGRIGYQRRGQNGFGYDPLFITAKHPGRTMAELSSDEKDAISHRGEAFRLLRPVIEKLATTL